MCPIKFRILSIPPDTEILRQDYSVHNIRKTHENYLISLNISDTMITKHMGHTQRTANEHYISSSFIKDSKELDKIRIWLGDAFSQS